MEDNTQVVKRGLFQKIKYFFKWFIPIIVVLSIGLYYLGTKTDSLSWSYWSATVNSNGTIPTKVYKLAVEGANSNYYSFTNPAGNPCDVVFGSKGVGLSCDYSKKVSK